MPNLKPTSIWITPAELKQAKSKAKRRDLSLSQLVRQLLRKLPPSPSDKARA